MRDSRGDKAPRPASSSKPRCALVLSGGGARGAYEAGVLRFLFEELPKDLGEPPEFDILTGTSVGAIHACFVAATAHLGDERGYALRRIWEGLNGRALFGSPLREVARIPAMMLSLMRGQTALGTSKPPDRLFGLLNTEGLEALVQEVIPWSHIQSNLREGRIQALSIAATEVATGRVVVFIETDPPSVPPWTHDASVVARAATIGPSHALASAAIPFLFPGVRVEGSYYVDGGVRLNTPLAPALRLGADRVLVVSLTEGPKLGAEADQEVLRVRYFGNPIFLVGKLLNALLLDRVETDLRHMRLLNDVLQRVRETGGREALKAVAQTVRADRGQPYKIIDDLVVRPSTDLGIMAGRVLAEAARKKDASILLRRLVDTLGFGNEPLEADLLSYVFFDSIYTRPLMELGFADAQRMREELVSFFRC
ncbi:MAG: patatin-like phospholipase family protein [Polyangiales bacterium]